jgi:hypothetical protein
MFSKWNGHFLNLQHGTFAVATDYRQKTLKDNEPKLKPTISYNSLLQLQTALDRLHKIYGNLIPISPRLHT